MSSWNETWSLHTYYRYSLFDIWMFKGHREGNIERLNRIMLHLIKTHSDIIILQKRIAEHGLACSELHLCTVFMPMLFLWLCFDEMSILFQSRNRHCVARKACFRYHSWISVGALRHENMICYIVCLTCAANRSDCKIHIWCTKARKGAREAFCLNLL